MIIGTLQFELRIPGAESLKDKRRVVKSVKDRIHREHMASLAETAALDAPAVAVLGLAVVGRDGKRIAQTLDRITEKLRALHDAEVAEVHREIIRGSGADGSFGPPPTGDIGDDLSQEMLDHARRGEEGLL